MLVDASGVQDATWAPGVHVHAEHTYDLSDAVEPVRTYLFAQVSISQRFVTLPSNHVGVAHVAAFALFEHVTEQAVSAVPPMLLLALGGFL